MVPPLRCEQQRTKQALPCGEQVSHLLFFRLQVVLHIRVWLNLAGNALYHADAGVLQRRYLRGIVGEQAYLAHTKLMQDLARELVLTLIGGKAELDIGLHRVEAAVLQFVSLQLRHQADAAPFLLLVDQDAGPGRGNLFERHLELLTAIAAQRTKHVSGEALRVDTNQRRLAVDIAHTQRYRRLRLLIAHTPVVSPLALPPT